MSVSAYLQIQQPKLAKESTFSLSGDGCEMLEELLYLDGSCDQRGDGGGGVVEFDVEQLKKWLSSEAADNFDEGDRKALAADVAAAEGQYLIYECY